MKKILTTFLLFCTINMTSIAVEFDESIDANIRQNYGVEENSLPPLPSSIPTMLPDVEEITTFNPTGKTYTIKSGTKVKLQSKSLISDWSREGSKVSFLSKQGIIANDGTIIPAGTVFKGTITDSHRPQMTGNGGLVELKIDEVYFNGVMSKIDTKVSLANSKKIFFSDIKGQRMYWRNFAKTMKPGNKFFDKTTNCASKMAAIPIINILSIIPIACGVTFYSLNLVSAPVISIFKKGGSISLQSGTEFEIKIIGNNEIKG